MKSSMELISFIEITVLRHPVGWEATLETLQTRPIYQNLLFLWNNSLAD